MADDVLLLAGTRKGLMIARKSAGTWRSDPLALPMTEVYAVAVDTRRPAPRLLAATSNPHWGPSVCYSDDLGRTWQEREQAPLAFPADTGAALERVWQIQPGPAAQPEVLYAGTEPTALFRSVDGGLTYDLVRALYFGTRAGEVYAGGRRGWTRVAANLPDVLSVRAAVLR